ncbi:porin [Enhydrobacter aerosaccus]|uniref:Porin n=1 Tax=Enhydrobacter aerosaccus TaxID=225324 RepID=A0A1T4LM02_9HYPH|nr:porin [Enhydrobacter aerosaccus]SJZ55742.1 porin [Enhydrobacter aerosaccus]
MRRLCLGSTALASTSLAIGGLVADPALAADPIKIGVGGYYQFYVLAGAMEGNYALNGTSVQYNGIQFIQQGEIYFNGVTKLDNGTSVGIRVQLEAWDPSYGSAGTDVRAVDEAYMYAFADWGRVEFGAKDGAAYTMYYGAPSALPGWGFLKHNSNFSWSNPVARGFNVAALRLDGSTIDVEQNKPNRINYYTPRIWGFQIGASYAPKVQPRTQPGSIWGLNSGPTSGVAGVCGFPAATAANGCPINDNSWLNAVAVAANYLNKFGDLYVAFYGGFSTMTFSPSLNQVQSAYNTINGANLSSWNQTVIGVQFGFRGFTVGGSWGWDNMGLGRNGYTGGDNDTRTWAAAVMYETGPWQMSAGFAVATNDNGNGSPSLLNCAQGSTSTCSVAAAATSSVYFGSNQSAGAATFGTLTASYIELGATYQLGPGVKLVGGAVFTNLTGPSNAVAAQSWAALLGMDLHF